MVKIVNRRKNTKQQLAHITQEMYKQNLELAERNKTLTLLRLIDEVVLSPADTAKVTQTIADILTDQSDFNLAIVYTSDKHKIHLEQRAVSTQAKLVSKDKQLLEETLSMISLHSQTELAATYADGTIRHTASFTALSAKISKPEGERLRSLLSVQTLFICPLKVGTKKFGVLILGLPSKTSEISQFVNTLIGRLTNTLSIAIDNLLLDEELEEASIRLRQQNRKLKELDKSKDEFISMASHQLRTPLTTVKGYLSMVLEGDVGPVTEAEKDYIKKAYDGAQKMVYLISDLLNVSRLQSGKFLIENKPTNLAELVESEVGQLQETAKEREITLVYHKPENFPTLNIDDNKIRQVVMNFLDNAIYYTPSGGTVTTELNVTDSETAFTVTDTGIGVPASLQHHLFTKFYRAENARKARPGGTGLGLFTAKKIIAAQGGAIIFKSTEGKGSTFGFSFPRAATDVKTEVKLPTENKVEKELAPSK